MSAEGRARGTTLAWPTQCPGIDLLSGMPRRGTRPRRGVFLGTSLMHLLADANSTIVDLMPQTYPFVYMLTVAGYLLTMLGTA
ncbi:hypothetical protein Taro_056559 [Colocasia esculenta]|uniref:Uncharacterized protein n=1 Tax=Colocasia esculenta TaxID=4460 RepID=A0A843XWI6_COLES|nr:hypothetical protein [Colocasia esculenta]